MAAQLGGMLSQIADYSPVDTSGLIPNSYKERDAAQNAGVTNPLLRGLMKSGAKALGGSSMASPQEQAKGVMDAALKDGSMNTSKGIAAVAAKMSSVGMQEEAMKLLALSEARARSEKADARADKRELTRVAERAEDKATQKERYTKADQAQAENMRLRKEQLELSKQAGARAESQEQRQEAAANMSAARSEAQQATALNIAARSGTPEDTEALKSGGMDAADYIKRDLDRRLAKDKANKVNTKPTEGDLAIVDDFAWQAVEGSDELMKKALRNAGWDTDWLWGNPNDSGSVSAASEIFNTYRKLTGTPSWKRAVYKWGQEKGSIPKVGTEFTTQAGKDLIMTDNGWVAK